LNSVTTASLTQLTIDSTFGTYLVNCKSCVGGYIEVSENSGSTWTIINPGNCSETNLVPQPSQSAYYRLFTSCSSVDQPFDPLVSDYSNEIFFVPYGIVNYKFTETGGTAADGVFTLKQNATTLVNASSSVSGTFWEIPSASFMTASLFATEFPLTGSTSMSLIVSGGVESFSTSSCLQSGGIFLDSWKVTPHLFYDVTASISHRPENVCTASNTEGLGYTVNSYDQSTGVWYHANQYGVPDTTGTYPSASISGSATRTNVVSGDCRYNAIQFSGSLTLPVNPDTSKNTGKIEDIDNCSNQIEELLTKNDLDSVFAVNELFAVTAIKTAKRLQMKVPEDVAIIGFTDGIISNYSSPSITTVSQNGIKMGNKAAQMLIERLESEDEENEQYITEVIETHLVQRESTPTLK
jgi:hypothetical protein